MLVWLVPVALFWSLAALYLGGFAIRIEESSGARHMGGLLLTFVLYLLVYWGLHTVLSGALSPLFSVIVAALVTSALLPFISRAGFRAVGVRITGVAGAH